MLAMSTTPNAKLLRAVGQLEGTNATIHSVRQFKRSIVMKMAPADQSQAKVDLRFVTLPTKCSVICFAIEDVGALAFELLPPCSQWEELKDRLRQMAGNIHLDMCSVFVVCQGIEDEEQARRICDALRTAYEVNSFNLDNILKSLQSLRTVFPSIRSVYSVMYKNSDGSDEQGVMVEVYGSDVVLFPIIAGHIVIIFDFERVYAAQAAALPHLAIDAKVCVGPTPAMLDEWLQYAPSVIDALVEKHSNITMVAMGPRVRQGEVQPNDLAVIIGVLKKGIRQLGEDMFAKTFTFGKVSLPIDVQEVRPFEQRMWRRQTYSACLHPGLSIGPKSQTWCGTLGGFLLIDGERFICSNEHVLPKSASAVVCQPSDTDVKDAIEQGNNEPWTTDVSGSQREIADRTHGFMGNITLDGTDIVVGVDVAVAKLRTDRVVSSNISAVASEKKRAKLPDDVKLREPDVRMLNPKEVLRAEPSYYFKVGRSSGLTKGFVPDSTQLGSFVVNTSWAASGNEKLYDIDFFMHNKAKGILHNQFVFLGSFGSGAVMSDSGDSGSFMFASDGQVIGLLHGGLTCSSICAIASPLAAVYAAIKQITKCSSVRVWCE